MSTPPDSLPVEAPGFDEPWQAQVHGISRVLIETGKIDPQAWARTLGGAIRKRLDAGAPDTTETYYIAMTDAIEAVLAVDEVALTEFVEAWRHAYETTPHGQPVVLDD